MNQMTDTERLARVRTELVKLLGPNPHKRNLHLTLGNALIWLSPHLDNGDEFKPVENLGETYRQYGLQTYEDGLGTSNHTELLRQALNTALSIISDLERKAQS